MNYERNIFDNLKERPPVKSDEYKDWIEQKDLFYFLVNPNLWNSLQDLDSLHFNFSNNASERGYDISNLYNLIIHKIQVTNLRNIFYKVNGNLTQRRQ